MQDETGRRLSTNYRGWQSDVIVDLIKRYGFPHITLNPGASFRGLHDSLVNYGGNEPPMMLCRSEEHTSELQSRQYLVCRLLLEKKKRTKQNRSLAHSTHCDCPVPRSTHTQPNVASEQLKHVMEGHKPSTAAPRSTADIIRATGI